MQHFIAVSGGKDSTALWLRLEEVEPRDYIPICTPTGDEPQELIEHWRHLEEITGRKITYLESGETLHSLIDHFKSLPNNRQRWCTRILKIEPCVQFLAQNLPCTLYVGLRADEEERQGGIYDDIPQRFPMREWGWGVGDVHGYLQDKGVSIPERTDCLRCYHQRLGEWWSLWKDSPEEWASAVNQEDAVSQYRRKECTFRNSTRDTWPTSLRDLGQMFASGNTPKNAAEQDMFGGKCRVCSM